MSQNGQRFSETNTCRAQPSHRVRGIRRAYLSSAQRGFETEQELARGASVRICDASVRVTCRGELARACERRLGRGRNARERRHHVDEARERRTIVACVVFERDPPLVARARAANEALEP